ncbi:MAG: class I SAM-dependent methyltransferase [Parvularculaceae bacterium]|nr:class I SAM-dependent methyltransferase [Parvularculaceae bacterium]
MSFSDRAALGAKRAVYSASQIARIAWFSAHYFAGRRRMGPITRPGETPAADESGPLDRDRLKQSFRELFRADWRDIKSGEYKLPLEARRAPSISRLMKRSRDYLIDTEKVARRKYANAHSEILRDELKDKYPRYYLQNFHFQTDGWLSAESADRYDMQVETLFTGAGAAMRRRALPFIRRAIAGRDPAGLHLLDIGCGAGGFLEQVLDNWPMMNATALDLSPAYLGKAQTTLSPFRNVNFVEAKAEQSGLGPASFDIISAVYLFHELPPTVRAALAREIARLLKRGGAFILVDTIQYGDEPGLDALLENFPRGFHEPYYDSYCRLDIAEHFAGAGLAQRAETIAFLTKATLFEKQ